MMWLNDHRSDLEYRRRVYLIVVGAGTVFLVLGLLLARPHDAYQRYLGLPLLVLGLVDFWWLATGRSLRFAEMTGYAVLSAATLLHTVFLTFAPSGPTLYPNSGPYWTLVCVCALGFLAFPARRAWRLNLGLVTLCLALPWLAHSPYAFQNVVAFFRLQSSVVVMLLLLGTLAALRTQVDQTGQAEQAMRALAFTDSLTNLPNRRAVYPAVERLLEAGRTGVPGTLHLIDIDHFKKINDQYGHGIGDDVLRAVAQLLATCETLPGEAAPTVGRWGGEEFLVVMPGTDRPCSEQRGQALLRQFRELPWPEGLKITVSLGSSTVRPDDTFTSLLTRADQALYQAKERGRDQMMLDS